MSESPSSALGAGIEQECNRPRGAVTTPDFVHVSPLMRSCIFGFNTHVAELPSSATDVKATGTFALGPCMTVPAAETAVRKAFLSQLPADLTGITWCQEAAAEKGRKSQPCPVEELLENAPWWVRGGRCKVDESGILPAEVRARLSELGQEVVVKQDSRDSRPSAKPGACKRGRQGARRPPAGFRGGYTAAFSKSAGEAAGNDSADGTGVGPLAVIGDCTQPTLAELNDSGKAGTTSSTNEHQEGGESDNCALLEALSLSLDKLAEDADADSRDPSSDSPLLGSPISPSHRAQDSCDSTLQLTDVVLPLEHSSFDKVTSAGSFCYNESFALPHGPVRSSEALDDIIEPAPGCVAWEERHATASVGGCSFIGLPLDARDVFSEMQMTMLALLEDLHAATCCCAAATSPEPCVCCFGAPLLLKSKASDNSISPTAGRSSGVSVRTGATRDCSGDSAAIVSSGTRSPSPIPARSLPVTGSQDHSASQCTALAGNTDTVRNGSDHGLCASSLHDLPASRCLKDDTDSRGISPSTSRPPASPAVLHAYMEASDCDAQPSQDSGASTSRKCFSELETKGSEKSEKDSASSPTAAGAKNSLRFPPKGSDATLPCENQENGDSLHLLFRHHVAVVSCASLFGELLPYSHIFRDCVGTYRLPTTLPSPSRHLLVQELLLLRQDPDRLLARNSFQWAEAHGSLLCQGDHQAYPAKAGGNAEAFQSDRLSRVDDMEGSLALQSSSGMRADVFASSREDRNAATALNDATGTCSSAGRNSTLWQLPLPLLDPSVLLCASGTELVAQKSAVLRILRMLRSLAPSWAARDDNFGFHFKSAISAASLDSQELQSYRVVFQCLSPFDAREWSREQLMEVLSDLDCIRLAHRRRWSLRSSVARIQRAVEQPEGESAASTWQAAEGSGSRSRWEISGVEAGAQSCQPRQVVREILTGQHATNVAATAGSPIATSSAFGLVQPVSASKEQHNSVQPVASQHLPPNSSGGRGASRGSAVASTRQGLPEAASFAESDADLQALAAGQAPLNSGTTLSASVTRRGQSPVGSSHSGRRNASVPDTSCLTGVKAGNSSPSDCPVRQQYAERAAELPKIKGVFIGKKHTCWVAQWNDANGQPRQSCFNIKQHGFEKARRLAVQARQALMGMSTSKATHTPPTEVQRAAPQPVQQAPSASRDAASPPTRLPGELSVSRWIRVETAYQSGAVDPSISKGFPQLGKRTRYAAWRFTDFMRDATAAIAEALGNRSVHTPTAVAPHISSKLEGISALTDRHVTSKGHNAGAATVGSSAPTNVSTNQTTKAAACGTITPRTSPRGAFQRPAVASLPAESSTASVAPQPALQKQEAGTQPSSVSSVASRGASSNQQLLLQHRLQQQLEEQLQQLQQLQQQLLQQSFATSSSPIGALSSLFPDVAPKVPPTPSFVSPVDNSSSAFTLMNSLIGGSAPGHQHVMPPTDGEHDDVQDFQGMNALRSSEIRHQTGASGAPGLVNEAQQSQIVKAPRGDTCVSNAPEESGGALRPPCGSAEVVEEEGIPVSSKRKHRLLHAQKQGKRTLASLAREFPSVGGVTYNVKCACWEVNVKGRASTNFFSTRKFGSLEAAYGAAVMWKRKVERGEQGVDDADGPEGQVDDGEDMEESEGLGSGPSPGTWEAAADCDESSRKRAACFRPDSFGMPIAPPVQPQQISLAAPQHSVYATRPEGSNSFQAEHPVSQVTSP